MNKKLKTINIKGKDYVEVNERLKYFRANFPKFSLTTEVLEKTPESILIKASIHNQEDRVIATGIAEEIKGSTFINKTSYVENCETSAWGRALANLGIGLDTSVASAEEVQNAVANQGAAQTKPVEKKTINLKLNDGNWEKVMKFVVDNKDKGLYWIVERLETKYNITKEIFNTIEGHVK